MHKRILLIDNEDSFSWNIWDLISQTGAKTEMLSLSKIDNHKSFFEPYAGVVIGPGPGNPTEMPGLQSLIENLIGIKPILGICLGFQAIACFFGAKIKKGNPKHGKVELAIQTEKSAMFESIPKTFQIVRYHSLVIENLPSPLFPTLISSSGDLMAFDHRTDKIQGLQFHPEAHLSQFGLQILNNWKSQL